jgi:nicotinamidase-related amidase
MAIETTAAGGALIKIFGVPVLAGAAATSLGFMFMWPTTIKEAFIRIICTILSSTILGPVLVIIVRSWFPGLFDSAKEVAVMYGSEPAFGFLFIAAPLMVMAGLPAWWVIGAVVRWFDVRKGKDIGEMAQDAAAIVHDVRGAL